MQLFLDTEFTDIVWPELIAVGLVSDCGQHEFYAELTDFNRRACTRFVWKQVLPKLGRFPAAAMDRPSLSAASLQRCVPRHVWRFIMTDHLPPKLQTVPPQDAHHALCDARVLRANWLAANAIARGDA